MSESKPKKGPQRLADRVLVAVAGRLGPELDRIDVDVSLEGVKVRDLVVEFATGGATSPTEVRVALLDLIEQGRLMSNPLSILSPDASVGLSLRGLLAARAIEPGCGRPVGSITLRMKDHRRCGLFGAYLETGQKGLDAELNRSGLTLAAFYVLGALKPTKERPLMLATCRPYFVRLAKLGVGPKSGPGHRLVVGRESITKALTQVARVAGACKVARPEDGRSSGWFLQGSFPEVRVAGATGPQCRDWTWLQRTLQDAINGRPFVDKENNLVETTTDQQVRERDNDADSGKAS